MIIAKEKLQKRYAEVSEIQRKNAEETARLLRETRDGLIEAFGNVLAYKWVTGEQYKDIIVFFDDIKIKRDRYPCYYSGYYCHLVTLSAAKYFTRREVDIILKGYTREGLIISYHKSLVRRRPYFRVERYGLDSVTKQKFATKFDIMEV